MKKMFSTLTLMLMLTLLASCMTKVYKCPDSRATYYNADGWRLKTTKGIKDGYVLIPEPGDAGSFMLGRYVRIKNGEIIEHYDRRKPEIITKTFKQEDAEQEE